MPASSCASGTTTGSAIASPASSATSTISSSDSSCTTGGQRASGSSSASACRRAASGANEGISGDGARSACTVVATACAASARASTPAAAGVAPAASERLTKDSAGDVTAVISGTSVMANAPLIVCIARNRSSVAGCGCGRDCASQCSTVARCWPTSASRISSNTLSTEAGVPVGAAGSGAAWAGAGAPWGGEALTTWKASSPAAMRSATSCMPSTSAWIWPVPRRAALNCGSTS